MARAIKPTRIVVETKIGKIKFTQNPSGSYSIRCKDLVPLSIRQVPGSDKWFVFTNFGILSAKTPEKAFKKASKIYWS
jgi:hypothetical protein